VLVFGTQTHKPRCGSACVPPFFTSSYPLEHRDPRLRSPLVPIAPYRHTIPAGHLFRKAPPYTHCLNDNLKQREYDKIIGLTGMLSFDRATAFGHGYFPSQGKSSCFKFQEEAHPEKFDPRF